MNSAEVRKTFLDFFASKGHLIVPSAPIVVKNDPTLMFTNAGMNQFKDYFLGHKTPPARRIADTQKCLRVSGKHNDLEEVGVDTYHHTMFEMLGNWSFGDYFKKEAIAWSWELLTEVYKLDKDRIYVTVFEGDEKENLPRDEEAYEEWRKWLPEDRILFGSKKDNFWEMGDTGPCGPCTEIHYDSRPEARNDGHALVNNDPSGHVMEIWNNVFIQFNRKKNGLLEPLPERHVDTGMGLERLVRILNGKSSNYDTDLFTDIIHDAEQRVKKIYEFGNTKKDIAFRVVADHLRAIGFTIADGQLPSNTGAGYVIRRILRRAVRYYFSYLEYKKPLLYQLVPVLARKFETVFPELSQQQDLVCRIVQEEEESFLRTLDKGLARIQEIFNQANGKSEKILSGKDAFELYDTYGFPLDLTKLIAAEQQFIVDESGFEDEMKKQKERSRAATTIEAEDWKELYPGENEFVGYDTLKTSTRILKYRKVKSKGKELYQIVLEKTPFYAESGGQVGDTGWLIAESTKQREGKERVPVLDTKKENDLIVHFTEFLPEHPENPVMAEVDAGKRIKTTWHHSATHLLHAALRNVLGTHVTQKGSLVAAEYLRFDFSHFSKLTEDEIVKIEQLVNEKIRQNIPVVIREMPKQEALNMGAMALFGEKYGDTVRVVIIDPGYSVELCGGTHAGATGELGMFKITAETSVAAGVRRIEAVCGTAAEAYVNEQLRLLKDIKELLKHPKDVRRHIETLQQENQELKKHLERMEARHLVAVRNELLQKDEIINGINFIGDVVEVFHPDALKKLCFDLKNHIRDHVVVLAVNLGGKPYVAISVSETVVKARNLDAARMIKEIVAPLIRGGGGGQKNLATAGGQDPSRLTQVIEEVKKLL
ncbi:MAG: alanine--tRNA ligase [Chitinophagaceae bacterium]|nr:alanine--tRNA ligase [Chitinophagaceae bacterium]